MEWNATHKQSVCEYTLHRFFEDQAGRTPDAPAVVFESQWITYRELNARANQPARYLIKRGIGPETLVGIYSGRSIDMLLAMLGVIKSGGLMCRWILIAPRNVFVRSSQTPGLL